MNTDKRESSGRPPRKRGPRAALALAGVGAALLLVAILRSNPEAPAPALQPPTKTPAAARVSLTGTPVREARLPASGPTRTPVFTRPTGAPTAVPPPATAASATEHAPPLPVAAGPDDGDDEEVDAPVPATPTEDAYPGVRAYVAPTATMRPYP
jgi:hypothetical protein